MIGMNPKTLQYLMGHSDIGVTMNTYTHSGLEDAAEELGRIEKLNAEKPVTLKPVPGRIVHIKIIIKTDPVWTRVHTGSSFDGWNQCCVLPLAASQSILRISSRHCSFAIHMPI